MEINVHDMKHEFSISHLPSANLMPIICFSERCGSNIFGLHLRAEKQTSIYDEHSAMNQLLLSFDEAKQECIDLHPIRTNKPINAMQEVNIHLKNAIHIGMPTMCSSGDKHIGDLEKHDADKRSESRNPKVKRSFSIESRETCVEQCFSNLNPIHDTSRSKQNSFEVFHRRHELQLQNVDSNINTNEDGAFLKNKIPYQIGSPGFVFERNVVSDPITGYDELEDNNVIMGNDWKRRCYAATSLLKLTSSMLTTRILNFCRSTSRPSISHVTPYQLGWKSCFLYTCLFFEMFPLMMPVSASVVTRVGGVARLNCSTTTTGGSVEWIRRLPKEISYIYVHPWLQRTYELGGRHHVLLDPLTGACDLVIKNVTESDAGKYICTETIGRRESYIELVVLLVSTAETNANLQHLIVLVGPSLRLHCSVNYPAPVIWRHEHVGTGDPNYVYHHDYGLRGQYQSGGRHSIEKGTNDLVITNVTDSDAGKYTCEEGAVLEELVDVYDIVILKSVPSCRPNIVLADVIGENDCSIDPDLLRLHCSVVYSGNFVPTLWWQNSGGEHVMIGSNISTPIQDETNHSTESTLTVTTNMGLHDTYFTCQVADSQSDGIVPECRTEKITVHSLYNSSVVPEINMKSEKDISCTTNSSQPCNYQWTHQNEKYKIAINGSTLNFRDVSFGDGIYECLAECQLRGQICRIMPRRITVVAGGMNNSEKILGDCALQNILIGVLSGMLFVEIILAFVRHRIITRNNKDHQTSQQSSLNKNVEDKLSVQVDDSDDSDSKPVDHHSLRLVPVQKESQKSSLFSSPPLIDLSSSQLENNSDVPSHEEDNSQPPNAVKQPLFEMLVN